MKLFAIFLAAIHFAMNFIDHVQAGMLSSNFWLAVISTYNIGALFIPFFGWIFVAVTIPFQLFILYIANRLPFWELVGKNASLKELIFKHNFYIYSRNVN